MRKIAFLFFLLLLLTPSLFAQVTFKASAPSAVVVGEQFRLAYTVNAAGKDIRIADMPDFQVLMGPNSSVSHSSSWGSGGQMTNETTTTYTYILMAQNEGTFTIPAATIKVNNSNYTSNTVTVKVLPRDQASQAQEGNSTASSAPGLGKDDLFMRMIVSKSSVYEQEAFLVTFKLYTVNPSLSLGGVKFPEFEGFLAQEIDLPENKSWELEHYNNRNYQTVVLKQTLLFPQRSGKITIGAGEYDVNVRVRVRQNVSSIFEEFYGMTREEKRKLTTQPFTVDVKPLPAGKPAQFSGGVGDFTMQTSISANQVKANEAVTIKVNISGTGNVRLIKNPEVIFPNDFEPFDPKVETNIRTTANGTTGTKTIEYLAIPRYGGDFEIPAIQFSYFDPKAGTYKTLTSDPYTLQVEKGDGGDSGSSPAVTNFGNDRERIKLLGQDIRYLKVKGINFYSKEEMFFGSLLYIMCYIIPALLFIIFFVLYRKQIKENADLARVRTRKANKTAVKRLKVAGKLMKENNKEAFYEEVLRALWGYLSDKLNIPQANLTKDNIETELTRYGVNEELINEFIEILNTCEFARYAPSQASDAMDNLYQLTVDAIGKMENTIKK